MKFTQKIHREVSQRAGAIQLPSAEPPTGRRVHMGGGTFVWAELGGAGLICGGGNEASGVQAAASDQLRPHHNKNTGQVTVQGAPAA